MQQATPTRFPTDLDHALSVIDLYFNLKPKYWLYEPVERFEHLGKPYVWNPDCVFVYQKKVYVCELQRTKLTAKRWAGKWKAYNLYFSRNYFHSAAFQTWSPKIILPQFLCISSQSPDIVRNGFSITGRDLIVCREFK
ncbi:hypothetical protein SD71_10855 [Cohnella kolymensis]|uniref:TnsA endonuclease N-terminal domain-containing protein n=1 Tax=Cohnella kolymensis TaxID=1590652 RepID=A0ABR5A4A9_9BACL|nr:hypothetical protein SD71_10855 [Cohnella kolymensis]